MKLKQWLVAAALVAAAPVVLADATAVDPKIPSYTKTTGVAGNLSSVGSDTLANLMTFWAEDFKKQYPNVNIQIQAAGSSTAPPALTEGTSNLGPMSRLMKDGEVAAFEAKYGYKPTAVPVAIDALAVFVHKDNPIKSITLAQIDAVFSSTRKCGASADVTSWGGLNMKGDWAGRPVQLFGRNSVSGTYGYFKEHALCKGDFKSNVNEQPGSASVVQSVGTTINAIGYSGIGYITSSVKALPVQGKDGMGFVAPTAANALKGTYPLSRYLYVYVNKKPNQPLSPLEAEFIKSVLSQEGQRNVVKDGFIPLPVAMIAKTRKNLGL